MIKIKRTLIFINDDDSSKKRLKRVRDKEVSNYEFDKGLVAIGADIAFSVDDFTEGIAKFNEFFFGTLPRKVAKVKNFGWGLCVTELVLV